MKLKDFEPNYRMLEIMFDYEDLFDCLKNMELLRYKEAVIKYGEYEIVSVMDFPDTNTTSVILKRIIH